MTDFDKQETELYDRFIAEIHRVMDEIDPWNEILVESEKYDRDAGHIYSDIWPSGFVSHPRLIAVVRKYFIEAEALILKWDANEDRVELGEFTEADWQRPEDDDEDEHSSTPMQMLMERMRIQDPGTYEHFEAFFLIPIGFDDHLEVTEEQDNG